MATTDAGERAVRTEFAVKVLPAHFGTTKLLGAEGVQDPEQRAQAAFYIARKKLGLDVNLSADYDFAGDPGQGAAVEVDGTDDLG
jgi:hypothetical protein